MPLAIHIGNKGYEDFNANDEIVNSSNYVQNEYKEIDFAIDLVSQLTWKCRCI